MADATSWGVTTPEPINFIVPWPGDAPPTAADLVATLSRHLDGEAVIVETIDVGSQTPAPEWCVAIVAPGRETPLVAWIERARPLDEAELPGAGAAGAWVLGIETVLDADDPLTDFHACTRIVARGLPAAPAMLDVNTTRWYPRADLEGLFLGETDPPAEVLWVTQLVAGPTGATWLHTHGLARCGAPELEMLEVPQASAAAAAGLLDCVAALMLEDGAPPPGGIVDVGRDLRVALPSWRDVAPYVASGAPGGMDDRPDEGDHAYGGAHGGARAVVCAPEPRGAYRRLWVWPEDAVRRVERGDGALYLTARETRRQQQRVLATWDDLLAAAATAAAEGTQCVVKAAFNATAGGNPGDSDGDREHLWFEVTSAERDRIGGRLLDAPVAVAGLCVGDQAWIERDRVSDWRVITPGGAYGPSEHAVPGPTGDQP